jgi:tryptophan synthase alpha chain
MSDRDKKLISYLPIGLKDEAFNIDLILSMSQNGTDIFEFGLPFSDPVADGGVIQEANFISLQNGYKIQESFSLAKKIQKENIDFVFMGYFNTFYQKGLEIFISDFSKGCIIPDLPYEEALEYMPLFDKYNKSLISFIAPTTPKDRIKSLVKDSSLFVYLVAYLGITGSCEKQEDLQDIINEIKIHTNTPIYLGFGVNVENAKEKSQDVDGVIVGSSFVKVLLDDSISDSQKIQKISAMSKDIKNNIN